MIKEKLKAGYERCHREGFIRRSLQDIKAVDCVGSTFKVGDFVELLNRSKSGTHGIVIEINKSKCFVLVARFDPVQQLFVGWTRSNFNHGNLRIIS